MEYIYFNLLVLTGGGAFKLCPSYPMCPAHPFLRVPCTTISECVLYTLCALRLNLLCQNIGLCVVVAVCSLLVISECILCVSPVFDYRPHPKDGGRHCFQFVSSHLDQVQKGGYPISGPDGRVTPSY